MGVSRKLSLSFRVHLDVPKKSYTHRLSCSIPLIKRSIKNELLSILYIIIFGLLIGKFLLRLLHCGYCTLLNVSQFLTVCYPSPLLLKDFVVAGQKLPMIGLQMRCVSSDWCILCQRYMRPFLTIYSSYSYDTNSKPCHSKYILVWFSNCVLIWSWHCSLCS